jgi:hypothetical protein
MAVTYTHTQVGKTNIIGNRKQKFYDLTATGTYAAGGDTITAASLGLKRFDKYEATGPATGGTAGATINWLGQRYGSENKTVIVQQYESAATGLPGLEKTDTEAVVSNFTVRVEVVGQ